MATENVQIKFVVDKSQLDGAVVSSKALETELKKAGVSANYMDAAMEGVNEALQESGVDAKTFAKAMEASAVSTKSLKTQLSEARNEAVKMSQQFGAFSKEAQQAAKKAALLKDEIADMNDVLDALNPEAKLNAFVKLGQGIQGGFQAATGALQVFGVENERITKLAQQFQGVLNLTQGINSVLQLKDVYGQLRLVLGLTTVATEGATAATVGFGTALSATGIGAVVVAVGALVLALYELEKGFQEADAATERLTKKWEDFEAARVTFEKTFNKILDARIDKIDFEIKKAEARGATEKELLLLTIERNKVIDAALGKAIASGRTTIEQEEILTKRRNKNGQELELLQIKLDRILKTEKEIAEVVRQQAIKTEKINPLPSPEVVKKGVEEVFDVIGTTIDEKASDLPVIPFFSEKEIRDRMSFAISAAQETLGVISAFTQAQYSEELAALEEQKQKGTISEENYQRKIRQIKRKAAEDDKKIQIFEATMSAAQAIIGALNTTPESAVPAAVALASIIGAANLAKIAATPIPKFKQGTLNVGGGNLDADGGMHAIIHRGEAVIPSDRNKDYHPTISALFHRQIKPSDINSFVEMKLKGKVGNTVAHISSKDLRSLKPSESVSIRNTNILARQIGREIARNQDPRMK